MSAAAITKPCAACKAHFIGLPATELCPDCEKDSEFYRLARKKNEPRKFIPYPELLKQWRARRDECRDWRKVEERAAADRTVREQAEREKSALLTVLAAMSDDLDPVIALASELDKVRDELKRERSWYAFWKGRAAGVQSGLEERIEKLLRELSTGTIPIEQWRRLMQLCHPDKHGGSVTANEATRWLMEVRP